MQTCRRLTELEPGNERLPTAYFLVREDWNWNIALLSIPRMPTTRRIPPPVALLIGIFFGLLFVRPIPWATDNSPIWRSSKFATKSHQHIRLPTLDQRHRVLDILTSLSPHYTKECTRSSRLQPLYTSQAQDRYASLVGHQFSSAKSRLYKLFAPDNQHPLNEHPGPRYPPSDHKYYFAINLHNSFDIIPDLFATLFRAASVLGYQNVYVSIYENGSTDQTKALLRIFDALTKSVGLRVAIKTSMRATRGQFNHRIEYLAEIRNAAFDPLHDLRDSENEYFETIIFMNDVLPCVDDLLELIWQSRRNNAGITCASDYMYHNEISAPVFYDNWVARDINGTALENAPFERIFHHSESAQRFQRHLPVQVQSCWNGIAILDSKPFYSPPHVRFRMARVKEGECSASECSLICNDYWEAGYGRIMMVPRVKLAYDSKVYDIIHPGRRNLTAIRGYKRLGGPPDDPRTDPQDRSWFGPHDRLFTDEESNPLDFRPGPDYVWCWGWDGAGDLEGPDVDPIWERRPNRSSRPEAVLVRHDRSIPFLYISYKRRTQHSARLGPVGTSKQRPIPYALVSSPQSNTLQRLVQVIMTDNMRVEISSGPAHESDGDQSGSAQIALITAQRVDMARKIEASILKVGKRKYWRAFASGMSFLTMNLESCLNKIHKDIISIWNSQDLEEFVLSDAFRRRMMAIVEDLKDSDTMHSEVTVASASVGKLWANTVQKNRPKHIRCLVGYVVDLILILQAMFQVSLQDEESKVTADHVDEIIYEFHCSEKKKKIHQAIRVFAQHTFAKDNALEKVQLLLHEYQMTQTDTRFNKERSPLRSLLTILRLELTANGLVVNRIILDLVRELLESPDFRSIVAGMDPLDSELLLDFILYLLQEDHLSTCGVPDASRKARNLMAKLISEANVIPQSLYITDVSFDADHGLIGIGGHARVLKGTYQGQVVALKMLDKQRGVFQEFCTEALVWRSLRHDFILPLLGIFKVQNLQFIVSPLMPNGTLAEWRKHQPTAVIPKIHMLISEVAQGVQYMHSEGIVHGFLTAYDILLDSDFHCRITDFGLTRHSDTTSTGTVGYSPNYAAPELFGICSECNKPQCNGRCDEKGYELQKKTTATDVYAFGCLYYAIFFDAVPYEGEHPFRIGWLVANGGRPPRLENPEMQESLWELINDCWKFRASERPTMHDIVRTLEALASSSPLLPTPPSLSIALTSLLGTLRKLAGSGGSIVNNDSVRAGMWKMLDLYESDAIASKLRGTSDIELLLNFVLDLPRHGYLTNSGIQEANQKSRKLTFKLIAMINAIPKFLHITDVKTGIHGGTVIGMGGFGQVYSGEYKGKQVALKVVTRGHSDDSFERDFCREAVAWRSLEHRFILPLLGVFEEKSQQFLVSPFMINGTLTQWRKRQEKATIADIDRLVLEVAEGIQYLHAEEIIHGDLHGRNVLLDSELHCRITDFGSMRHSGIPVTRSTTALSVNYAAPELFGLCTKCRELKCDGRHGNQTAPHRSKTKETDVYAFGCLYYEIFFNKVPFYGNNHLQVMQLVITGARPARLLDPRIEDKAWDLIQSCMKSDHSERPTMEQIVSTLHSFAQTRF